MLYSLLYSAYSRIPIKLRKLLRPLASPLKKAVLRDVQSYTLNKAYHTRKSWLLKKPPGVNLVAYIRAEMGLGEAARGVAKALEAAKIPFNILNFEYGNPSRHTDTSWIHKEVSRPIYDVTILKVNAAEVLRNKWQLPKGVLNTRYTIGFWAWELPEFPDEWLPAFSLVDEVWVYSRFVQETVSIKSPVPVIRVPPSIHLTVTDNLSRRDFDLPEKGFLFLSTFDTRSVLQRKNPWGVVKAFKKSFSGEDRSVGLVLKINNADHQQTEQQLLKDEIGGYSNIYLLDRRMSREEINSLMSLTDCFTSLHRSEGFGLGPAEAMSLGKPVIVTNWSGNTDYMASGNSIGIDYELVKIDKDYGPYRSNQYWAEPDIDQAAFWMKKLAQDSALARRIGETASETIKANFSPEAVGRLIEKRLRYIRHKV